jgi:hypothetical protein
MKPALRSRLRRTIGTGNTLQNWSWPGWRPLLESSKPLWLLAIAAALLGWSSPVTLAASFLIVLLAALLTRKLFAGIGLALLVTPPGFWLVEHPHPLAILLAAAICAILLWWYREAIRASL